VPVGRLVDWVDRVRLLDRYQYFLISG
jgi:hypothetical protein